MLLSPSAPKMTAPCCRPPPGCRPISETNSASTSAVNAVAILPDGRLVTGGEDGKIAVWPPVAAEPAQQFSGHTAPIVAHEIGTLKEIGQVMRDASICGLGQTASSAVESALHRWSLFS